MGTETKKQTLTAGDQWVIDHAVDTRRKDRKNGQEGRFRLFRYRIDVICVALVLFALGLQIAAYAGAWSWYWYFPIVIIMRWAHLSEHHHAHIPVFYQGPLNEILGWMHFLNGGIPLEIYRLQHVKTHHRHLNREKDFSSPFDYEGAHYPDKPISWWYYLLTYTTLSALESTVHFIRRPASASTRRYFLSLAVVFGTAIILGYYDLRSFLLFFYLPWLTTYIAAPINNWDHHVDCEYEDLFSSANNDLRFLCRTFGLNIGYHAAHHWKASLHWSLLAEFHHLFMEPNTHLRYYRPKVPPSIQK